MTKEYESLKLEYFKLHKKVDRCVNLLLDIEWIFIEGEEVCLFCKGKRNTGHEDCDLGKELEAKG